MDADLDRLLITAFCTSYDLRRGGKKNARRSASDAKVITPCVALAIMGVPCDPRFLAVASKRLCHLCPRIPKRSCFQKCRAKLADTIESLIAEFAGQCPGCHDNLPPVDSQRSNAPEASRPRAARHWATQPATSSASHSRFFWSFRLHGLFAPDGTPRALSLRSPRRGEREVALELTEWTGCDSEIVIGDTGCTGVRRDDDARALGAHIVRPSRKDEGGRGPDLAPIRQRIESIIWTFTGIFTEQVSAKAGANPFYKLESLLSFEL